MKNGNTPIKESGKLLDEFATNRMRWSSTENQWMYTHGAWKDLGFGNDFIRFCVHFTMKWLTLTRFLDMDFHQFARRFPLDQEK